MLFPEDNLVGSGVTFTLYKDGVPVSSGSGGAAVGEGVVPGAGKKTYYNGASTPMEFDAVEAVVNISGNPEELHVQVYEFCGDR